MKKVFAEVGYGNDSFFSTEFEEGETGGGAPVARPEPDEARRGRGNFQQKIIRDSEYRVPQFIRPAKVEDYYIRIWIGKKVFVYSTKDGFKIRTKDRNKLKVLFGIGGEGEA